METLKSSKSRRSISATNSTAAVTSASTGFSRSSSCRCLGREPEFTPIRIGVPFSFAFTATSATFSRPPMLPGLRRMQWAPASIAFSARVWLKWMSAMIGIGDSLTIVFSASTSCSRGTAQRTMSAPASATLRICSIVAVRLAVSVLVIVCTATGAPPPIGTPPTKICRLEAIYEAYPGSWAGRLADVVGIAAEAADVVGEADHHQHHHQREPDHRRPLHHPQRDRAAAQFLDDRPEDVAAVERQDRQQVDQTQREADQGQQQDRFDGAAVDRLVGDVADADDAGDLLALFLLEDAGEDRGGFLGHLPDHVTCLGDGGADADLGRFGPVGEADESAFFGLAVLRPDQDHSLLPVAADRQLNRRRRQAALDLLTGALVRGDLLA